MLQALWSDTISKSALAQLAGMVDGGGTVYYVDDVHANASDSNAGTDRNRPFNTLTAAITASEVDRQARSNVYTRNTIYVIANGGYAGGTIDGYAITEMPQYTNLIGVGANPWGSGSGIATIIGTNATVGTVRGLYAENLMFEVPVAGAGYYGLYLTHCLRSKFYNCAFMGANTGSSDPGGGLYISGSAGGMDVIHCKFNSNLLALDYGIRGAASNFNSCNIEDNSIFASVCGIYNVSPGTDGGTIIKNNVIAHGPWNAGYELATGVQCTGGGNAAMVIGNYIAATDAINHSQADRCCIDNHIIQTGTGAIELVST